MDTSQNATAKQVGYIRHLLDKKGFSGLDDVINDIVKDLQSMDKSAPLPMNVAGLAIQHLKSKPDAASEEIDNIADGDIPW